MKMMPDLLENGSNLWQKIFKIQAWRQQHRGQEGPGASLEADSAVLSHLGRFWKRLGPSWKRLGGDLEASLASLVRERWPTWLQVGSENGAQVNKKKIQKLINFLMPLGINLFRFFMAFWIQKNLLVSFPQVKNVVNRKGRNRRTLLRLRQPNNFLRKTRFPRYL